MYEDILFWLDGCTCASVLVRTWFWLVNLCRMKGSLSTTKALQSINLWISIMEMDGPVQVGSTCFFRPFPCRDVSGVRPPNYSLWHVNHFWLRILQKGSDPKDMTPYLATPFSGGLQLQGWLAVIVLITMRGSDRLSVSDVFCWPGVSPNTYIRRTNTARLRVAPAVRHLEQNVEKR